MSNQQPLIRGYEETYNEAKRLYDEHQDGKCANLLSDLLEKWDLSSFLHVKCCVLLAACVPDWELKGGLLEEADTHWRNVVALHIQGLDVAYDVAMNELQAEMEAVKLEHLNNEPRKIKEEPADDTGGEVNNGFMHGSVREDPRGVDAAPGAISEATSYTRAQPSNTPTKPRATVPEPNSTTPVFGPRGLMYDPETWHRTPAYATNGAVGPLHRLHGWVVKFVCPKTGHEKLAFPHNDLVFYQPVAACDVDGVVRDLWGNVMGFVA